MCILTCSFTKPVQALLSAASAKVERQLSPLRCGGTCNNSLSNVHEKTQTLTSDHDTVQGLRMFEKQCIDTSIVKLYERLGLR